MKTKVYRDPSGNVVHIGEWKEKRTYVTHEPVGVDEKGKPLTREIEVTEDIPVPKDWIASDEDIVTTEDGARYAKSDYSRLRQREYPPLVDQINALLSGNKTDVDKIREQIERIKTKYPKPVK